MQNIFFTMAIHFHQPVGNFDSVIENAYKKCYKPFIEQLCKFPEIRLTLHFSGCLIDYLERRHPEILDLVKDMVKRGQIEMMAGAYYEPILVAIPQRDITSQIRMMKDYIKKRFGANAQGMWIPERVWVPDLAPLINNSGIKWCILDDTHFKKAGLTEDDLHGYYMTGRSHKKIAVFPSDKRLRYSIPFKEPHETINYFKEAARSRPETPVFIYGDDGEKFGEWPGTHKWVFEQTWLKRFFEALMAEKNWIKLITFSEYLKSNKPLGEIEIPEASYDEMMEWIGPSWMNFLFKYPESNQMHKKMYYVSAKIEKVALARLSEGDRLKLEKARTELFMGQCNCPYWHGVFGGLYLYHLRSSAYSHLIEADRLADSVIHKSKGNWSGITISDYDQDGCDEAVMENKDFALYIDPGEGGVIKEIDYRKRPFNLTNTLSRKKEAYHDKIIASLHKLNKVHAFATIHADNKEMDPHISERGFVYDKYPRYSLRDYFLNNHQDRKNFMDSIFEDLGDFAEGEYSVSDKKEYLMLARRGVVRGAAIYLTKQITLGQGAIEIGYSIKKEDEKAVDCLFGVEFNFTMPELKGGRYNYSAGKARIGPLDSDGQFPDAANFGIADSGGELGLEMSFTPKARKVWYFPVKTISQSEKAYELNYQCSSLIPLWALEFDKKGNFNLKIEIRVNPVGN